MDEWPLFKNYFSSLKNNGTLHFVLHRLLPVLTFLIIVFVLPIVTQENNAFHGQDELPTTIFLN